MIKRHIENINEIKKGEEITIFEEGNFSKTFE